MFRCLVGREQNLNTRAAHDRFEGWGEDTVPIDNKESLAHQEPILAGRQISSDLLHPGRNGIRRGSSDLDPTCGDVDHDESVVSHQTAGGPYLRGEEVRCGDQVGVRADERGPAHRSVWRGRDPVFLQRLGDGSASNAVV